MARTERKHGLGHSGFEIFASADTTLLQDLSRRDLTINAIALSSDGEFYDPHNGLEDSKRYSDMLVTPSQKIH